MLEVQNIQKSFNTQPLLKGVSFDLNKAEYIGLIGPSGGGKSTLLKIIAGLLVPDSGKVNLEFSGESSKTDEVIKGPSKIAFLFQSGALFDSKTVMENVIFPLMQMKGENSISYSEAFIRARNILCEVGLEKSINKIPGELSGGMRRRVALARTLVSNPKLALLDDPTAGLDPVAANVIMELIRDLQQKLESSIILVSHDLRRLIPRVSRVVCLFDGVVSYDGPSSNISSSPAQVKDFVSTRYDF